MAADLTGCWAKFDRGEKHSKAFNRALKRLIGPSDKQAVPLDPEIEEDKAVSQTILWRVGPLPNIADPKFALIIGDCLGNFRAALDQLAWIMVKRKGGGLSKLKASQKRQIAFPLARSRDTFPDALRRNLPGIDRTAKLGMLVERYQPYGRGKKAGAMRGLRNLSDRDKHRLLIPTFWYPGDAKLWLDAPGFSIIDEEILVARSKHPLKTGAPILRATVVSVSMHNPKVELKGEGILYPALGGSWHTLNLLKGIRDTVKEILDEATPHL